MAAKYILRFDDAHSSMNFENWGVLEGICDKYGIKPIVGLIPKNEDNNLVYKNENNYNYMDFITRWKNKGWVFALHGYEHKLKPNVGNSLVKINNYSEFVGVNVNTQCDYIKKGLSILDAINVNPVIWIAPAHGFDRNTIIALKRESNIEVISDGLRCYPFLKLGMKWLPQQLWKPRKMYFGIWTICLHPSSTSSCDIARLECFLENNHSDFIIPDDINQYRKRLTALDFLLKMVFEFKRIGK